ncbi:LysR family transcriptional regulator, partial [Escherichia coli]
ALRAFEASARYLNFTKAGLELHVSQAAVSQHVRTLEAILGVNLFKRLPRGLQLTEEGLHLLPMINEAFSIMGS